MYFDPIPSGDIAVVGVLGDPGNGFGGIPVTLLSNITDSIEMRFASTPEELALSEWQDYHVEVPFWMRTGGGDRTLYAEYKDAFGNVTVMQAVIPAFDPELGTNYAVPISTALQPEGSTSIWVQDFADGHDTWVSYDYNGGDPNGANVFYATSWNSSGGVDNGSYIWTDASRWLIDTPETPHSVLALLTYSQWATFPDNEYINLNGTQVEFYLRGDDLDLQGGSAYFWLVDQYGRWHQHDIVLDIGDGEWALNSIDIGFDTSGWANSWTQNSSIGLNYTAIRSWGISFVGFPPGVEPTGVLALDEFTISRRPMTLAGTDDADTLLGGRGDDTISGAAGADVLDGDEGNDSLHGNDGNDVLKGGAGDDLLFGGEGNDTLIGGVGADRLEGGAGDDVYHIDSEDNIIELEFEGFDIVHSSGSYVLTANIEALYLHGSGNYVGTGNALANYIYGDIGNDRLFGHDGNDLLDGGAGNDALDGGAGDDWLRGGDGNDTLTGGDGADRLEGGAGDDVYYVDSADTVLELENNGHDIVHSAGSYQLGANVEALFLHGSGNYIGTGNELANYIYGDVGNDFLFGHDGDDLLDGGVGNDTLDGGAGNDWLRGGDGNDTLIGGDGADRLEGGAGDDVYHVTPSDTVVELENGGFDIVHSAGSYNLGSNVEAVYITGIGNYVGTGNALANYIYGDSGNDSLFGHDGNDLLDGSAGNDLLDGGDGADWLRGGMGNDTLIGGNGADHLEGGAGDDVYYVDSSDLVTEHGNGGFDIVHSNDSYQLGENIEAVYLHGLNDYIGKGNELANYIYGDAGNDILFGYGGNDLLDGGAGDDRLDGGAGNDSLRGGEGDDLFIFTGDFGRDAIRGFQAGADSDDRIQFDLADFVDFAAIKAASSTYMGGTLVTSGENSVYLIDVDIVTLHESDFVLV